MERIELHLHTNMSKMDGVTKCKDYIEKANEYKMTPQPKPQQRTSTTITRTTKKFGENWR